jgi:hypothetical protein
MFDERESAVSASAESSGRGSDADDKQAGNRADAAQKTGVTFCFGSAGWLFVYYLGVIKRIKELELHRCVSPSVSQRFERVEKKTGTAP